jgi:uncharacterized protein YndB with AHSA1/START domain
MEPIKHQLRVKASPEAAYRAMATAEGIKAWWCADSDVMEIPGGEQTLRFKKGDMPAPVTMRFKVDALEPARRVVWTCTGNDNPAWLGTQLAWDILADGQGSKVDFGHDGWQESGPNYQATVEGWRFFMASLQSYLDGGPATPQ